MIALEHIALYVMAIFNKGGLNEMSEVLTNQVSWLVLPDVLSQFYGARQIFHFEQNMNKTDSSWVVFPKPGVLKEMSKKGCMNMMDFHIANNSSSPRKIQLGLFDEKNYFHPYFNQLRTHLIQDIIFDDLIQKKEELENQGLTYDEFRFLHLAGRVYQQSGILLNQRWLDQNVFVAFLTNYSEELAEASYSLVKLPNFVEKCINNLEFASMFEGNELIDCFDKIYAKAYLATMRSMF